MKTSETWTTRPISPTCEVIWVGNGTCDHATSYAYPAMGGGWMALCERHAMIHHPHCEHIDKLIQNGETFS